MTLVQIAKAIETARAVRDSDVATMLAVAVRLKTTRVTAGKRLDAARRAGLVKRGPSMRLPISTTKPYATYVLTRRGARALALWWGIEREVEG